MRDRLREHVKAYSAAVGFIGVAVTIVGFAIPGARHWMHGHSAVGWLSAGMLLTVTLALLVLLDASRQEVERARSATVVAESERDAATRAYGDQQSDDQRAADGELLTDLLGPWRQGCQFMVYLADSFVGDRIPNHYYDEVQDRAHAWSNDRRTLNDPEVDAAFRALQNAVNTFRQAAFESMWLEPGYQTVAVPSEWEATQPQRREDAIESIGDAGLKILYAMRDLFGLLHQKRVELGDVGYDGR